MGGGSEPGEGEGVGGGGSGIILTKICKHRSNVRTLKTISELFRVTLLQLAFSTGSDPKFPKKVRTQDNEADCFSSVGDKIHKYLTYVYRAGTYKTMKIQSTKIHCLHGQMLVYTGQRKIQNTKMHCVYIKHWHT